MIVLEYCNHLQLVVLVKENNRKNKKEKNYSKN